MEQMKIRQAQLQDAETIMSLIAEAKQYLKNQGVDQWQTGYPDRNIIVEDLTQNRGYIVTDGSEAAAYLCIGYDGEPSHSRLKGEWKSSRPYAIVHRMAIRDAYRGRGLSALMFRFAEQLSREKGIFSIHADTDEENAVMRHLLEKNGFACCGTIWFDNSVKYAYEKVL